MKILSVGISEIPPLRSRRIFDLIHSLRRCPFPTAVDAPTRQDLNYLQTTNDTARECARKESPQNVAMLAFAERVHRADSLLYEPVSGRP